MCMGACRPFISVEGLRVGMLMVYRRASPPSYHKRLTIPTPYLTISPIMAPKKVAIPQGPTRQGKKRPADPPTQPKKRTALEAFRNEIILHDEVWFEGSIRDGNRVCINIHCRKSKIMMPPKNLNWPNQHPKRLILLQSLEKRLGHSKTYRMKSKRQLGLLKRWSLITHCIKSPY